MSMSLLRKIIRKTPTNLRHRGWIPHHDPQRRIVIFGGLAKVYAAHPKLAEYATNILVTANCIEYGMGIDAHVFSNPISRRRAMWVQTLLEVVKNEDTKEDFDFSIASLSTNPPKNKTELRKVLSKSLVVSPSRANICPVLREVDLDLNNLRDCLHCVSSSGSVYNYASECQVFLEYRTAVNNGGVSPCQNSNPHP